MAISVIKVTTPYYRIHGLTVAQTNQLAKLLRLVAANPRYEMEDCTLAAEISTKLTTELILHKEKEA